MSGSESERRRSRSCGGEPCEPYAGVGGEGQRVVVPVASEGRLQERVEGVREGDDLGRVDALDRGCEPPVRVVVGSHARVETREKRPCVPGGRGRGAPMRQRGPVSRRTSEALAPGVLEDLADGDQVGDLGQVQQPGEADDLHRDVAGDEGALDLGEVGRGTAQDGDLAGCRSGAYEMGDGVGEPVHLLGVGAQQCAAHHAVALGARGGAEGLHARVQGAQGLREAVGEVEEAAAAAAVLAECLAGRRGCRRSGAKCSGKSSRLATEAPRQP